MIIFFTNDEFVNFEKKITKTEKKVGKIEYNAVKTAKPFKDVYPTIRENHPELMVDDWMVDGYDVELDTNIVIPCEGYKFVGMIDHRENLIFSNRGDEIEQFRHRCTCDHCNTKRHRNKTVILEKDGKFVQIGTKCLEDYTGVNLTKVINRVDFLMNLEPKERDYDSCGMEVIGLKDVVAYAIMQNREYGFTPASEGMHSSANQIFRMFDKYCNDSATNADYKTAVEVIEWMKNIEATNTFTENLKQIALNGFVTEKSIRVIPAAVNSFYKSKVEKENTASEWVGNVGEKNHLFEATLTNIITFDGYYGTMNVHFFNNNGNVIVWKSKTKIEESYGTKMTFKATIKEHTTYNNIKQTAVTWLKLV